MRRLGPSLAAVSLLLVLPAGAGAGDPPIHAQAKARGVDAKIVKGTLRITGDKKANRITLRLRRRAANTLELDVGGSSRAELTFNRRRFTKILVRGGSGSDRLRIDDRNGGFTTSERTTLQGDAGNDTLTGGRGRETLSGGAGNDSADGNGGKDSAKLGTGDDTFRWDFRDGNDSVRGEAGNDRLAYNGSTESDAIAATPNGGRLRIARATERIEADDFEAVDLTPLGGPDSVTIDDLAGTDVVAFNLNLAKRLGRTTADAKADQVIVNGGGGGETIGVSGNGATFAVTGLATAVAGGAAEPADRLTVNGLGGADSITTSLTGLPFAADGGEGDDTLTGGPGAELLGGGPGNDRADGNGGDDTVLLGDGDDTFTSDPGDGFDLVEGGGGSDLLVPTATDAGEAITVSAENSRLRVLRDGVGTIDAGEFERVDLNTGGGNDTVNASGLPAGLVALSVAGGDGDDSLTGSPGDDSFRGGPGTDTALLGDGADTYRRDVGDGADVVEGQGGADRAELNGSDASEVFIATANGARVSLVQDGAVAVDADDVERVDFNPLGGGDFVTINDLTGTDVTQTISDLAATLGGAAGDGQIDNVTVNGTGAADNVTVDDGPLGVTATGLAAAAAVRTVDLADRLTISTGGGGDTVNASGLPDLLQMTLDGGPVSDTLTGSEGSETFRWDPGDANDVLEGRGNLDRLEFNGSNASENVDVQPNGARLRFVRDVAAVIIDADDVEEVRYNAFGGADNVDVADMTGTDVTQVTADLDLAGGALGDGAADTVNTVGRVAAENVIITGNGTAVNMIGLAARVSVVAPESANDTLRVDTLGGTDTIDARNLPAGQIALTLIGNDQNDIMFGSGGVDTFVWNPGDASDTIDGDAGFDTLLFNGSNASEIIDISRVASSVLFTRDVANVMMNLTRVEAIDYNALGGGDTITAHNMQGTALSTLSLDLSAAGDGAAGDAQADSVIVDGTADPDVVTMLSAGSNVSVFGLAATVSIQAAENANDRLTVNGFGGGDTLNGSGVTAAGPRLTLNGGIGEDALLGGASDDILNGEADDDFLDGNGGNDTLNGGTGTDVEIQD